MAIILKILISVVIFLGGLCIYASTTSSKMNISREIIIQGTPDTIFPYLNNSKLVNSWMPWNTMDPEMVMSFSGPDSGIGATSSWVSKGKMGTGEALVIESVPNQYVKTQLSYTKPFQMSQLATMSLKKMEGGTKVVWSVEGNKDFFFRLMGLFFDCEKMIGKEFEKGLETLKKQIEHN